MFDETKIVLNLAVLSDMHVGGIWHMDERVEQFHQIVKLYKRLTDNKLNAFLLNGDFTNAMSSPANVVFGKYDQPDTYEYGMSRAAAWDCPATIMFRNQETLESVPRLLDVMEVIRRWEDVRKKKWLTEEQKLLMRDTTDEYTLIIDKNGEYQLVRYYEIEEAPEEMSAFTFEYDNSRYVALWHKDGEDKLTLTLPHSKVKYLSEVFGEELEIAGDEGSVTFTVNSKKYLKTTLSEEKIRAAFKAAKEISEMSGKNRKVKAEEDLIR